jgi:hypothetical protein
MNQGTRLILSEKKKDERNPMFHKEHSEETKRKMSEKIKEMWIKNES